MQLIIYVQENETVLNDTPKDSGLQSLIICHVRFESDYAGVYENLLLQASYSFINFKCAILYIKIFS